MVKILPYSGEAPCSRIFAKFGTQAEVPDVLMCTQFLVKGLWISDTPKIVIFLSQAA